jgi:hypothetical protein
MVTYPAVSTIQDATTLTQVSTPIKLTNYSTNKSTARSKSQSPIKDSSPLHAHHSSLPPTDTNNRTHRDPPSSLQNSSLMSNHLVYPPRTRHVLRSQLRSHSYPTVSSHNRHDPSTHPRSSGPRGPQRSHVHHALGTSRSPLQASAFHA